MPSATASRLPGAAPLAGPRRHGSTSTMVTASGETAKCAAAASRASAAKSALHLLPVCRRAGGPGAGGRRSRPARCRRAAARPRTGGRAATSSAGRCGPRRPARARRRPSCRSRRHCSRGTSRSSGIRPIRGQRARPPVPSTRWPGPWHRARTRQAAPARASTKSSTPASVLAAVDASRHLGDAFADVHTFEFLVHSDSSVGSRLVLKRLFAGSPRFVGRRSPRLNRVSGGLRLARPPPAVRSAVCTARSPSGTGG